MDKSPKYKIGDTLSTKHYADQTPLQGICVDILGEDSFYYVLNDIINPDGKLPRSLLRSTRKTVHELKITGVIPSETLEEFMSK